MVIVLKNTVYIPCQWHWVIPRSSLSNISLLRSWFPEISTVQTRYRRDFGQRFARNSIYEVSVGRVFIPTVAWKIQASQRMHGGSAKWMSSFRSAERSRCSRMRARLTEQKCILLDDRETETDGFAETEIRYTSCGSFNRTIAPSRYIPSWSRECSLSYAKRGRNNGVSSMHDRANRQTALREIALHTSDGHMES